jgi:DNA-binding GntR family transcriptional regulator
MLEVAALDDVVDNLNSESLAECQRIVDRCTRCAARGDVGGFLDADREFHLKLVGSLGNQRLVEIVDRLRDQTRLYGLLKLAPEGLVASAAEHADLLLAISEGDIRAGRKILTRHLEHIRGIWAGRPDTAT